MTRSGTAVVLFDVGGVLVTSRPNAATVATVLGLPGDDADTVDMVDKALWFHREAYDAGASDRAFWDSVAGDCGLPELDEATVAHLVHEDVSRSRHPDADALGLAVQLHDHGLRLGILSNAPVAIARAIEGWPWAGIFESFTFSGPLGQCKPERAIYRSALDDLDVPAESVLFIDDREPNLRAAELIGMTTLTWQGAMQARAELVDLGILDTAEVA